MLGEWGRGITPPFSASLRPGCLGRGREHPGISSVMVPWLSRLPGTGPPKPDVSSSGMASPCSRRPIWGCSVADCRRQRWARDVLNFVVYPDRLTRPPARSPSHRGRPAGFHRTWFSMPSCRAGDHTLGGPPAAAGTQLDVRCSGGGGGPEHSSMSCVPVPPPGRIRRSSGSTIA